MKPGRSVALPRSTVRAPVGTLTDLFEARVDGLVASQLRLPGKPAPLIVTVGDHEAEPGQRGVVFNRNRAGDDLIANGQTQAALAAPIGGQRRLLLRCVRWRQGSVRLSFGSCAMQMLSVDRITPH